MTTENRSIEETISFFRRSSRDCTIGELRKLVKPDDIILLSDVAKVYDIGRLRVSVSIIMKNTQF